MDRYTIISADGHAGAPQDGYRPYLDPEFRARFDDYVAGMGVMFHSKVEDRLGGVVFKDEVRKAFHDEEAVREGGISGSWDPERRLRELEADGVVADVIFPDMSYRNAPPFFAFDATGFEAPAYQRAGARAYNRWLVDFVSTHPDRHAGLAIVRVDDIEAAVKEVEWAREVGLRGVLIPAGLGDLPFYHHPRYEPLWSACAETGLPVHTHGGTVVPDYGGIAGSEVIFLTEQSWFSRRPLWFLIWGGVFERHPKLKFVLTELGSTWVPETLRQLDGLYTGKFAPQIRKTLSLKPSEYWARQCTVEAMFLQPTERDLRHAIGVPNIIWGSDYPHLESTWPHTREKLRQGLSGLPEPELRAILGENAARLYNLDLAKLEPVAARVGPRVDEI
jgi:predicted TIM-barrel fold metal-dependent hydrolase